MGQPTLVIARNNSGFGTVPNVTFEPADPVPAGGAVVVWLWVNIDASDPPLTLPSNFTPLILSDKEDASNAPGSQNRVMMHAVGIYEPADGLVGTLQVAGEAHSIWKAHAHAYTRIEAALGVVQAGPLGEPITFGPLSVPGPINGRYFASYVLPGNQVTGVGSWPDEFSGAALVSDNLGLGLTLHLRQTLDDTSDNSGQQEWDMGAAAPKNWLTGLVFLSDEPLPQAARIRSHVSEDAGSLFQATQAIAVESGVSEAFPYDVMPESPRTFREALTPAESSLVYYPVPTRNREMLVTVEGETNLGRMASVYPSGLLRRVEDLEDIEGDTATAQQAIQYIFDQWASEFDWFHPEPVPDLRVLVDGAVGDERQYYLDNPEAGVLTTAAIAIPQDGNERRSMREIVDEWLAIFTGTIIRQNSNGRIELVPRIGPDAPDEGLELSWRDIITMSDGEDDPRGVRNRARVVSQGYEFIAEQAVAEPAYAVLRAVGGLTVAALEDGVVIPDGRVDMGGLYQLLPFTGLASRDDVEVSYTLTAYSSRNPDIDADLVSEASTTGTLTLAPNGTGTITLNHTVLGIHNLTVRVYLGRATSGDGLMITAVTGMPAKVDGLAFDRYLAYILEVDAVGSAWARATGEITGSFGYASETLPAEGGGNALDNSVSLYGEREAVIRSTVFQLTAEQAQQVARGYVLANINPRTIREVQQSEWDRFPVKFDHIGRLVDLPNGERAVVENRSYSDAFQPGGGMMQSAFTATVTEIVLDTTTAYLLMDDGSYLLLDDGSLTESA